MQKTFIFFILYILNLCLQAQNYQAAQLQNKPATSISDETKLIRFHVADKNQINNDLTYILSIDYVRSLSNGQGYEVTAYATPVQFQQFLTRNIAYELINPLQPKALTMATTVAAMANWDRYPTYSVYEQMMANFAANYPGLCDIDTILNITPSGNYRILVARISDNVNLKENEPQFLYTSSMHGDELTGFILTLRLIDYLLLNYGTNTKVTNLVNNLEIWINPLANPEGSYYGSNPAGSTIATSRRGNFSNVDLNRNYPDPRDGQHPDGYSWQPETQAFMNFAGTHHFNMSANFHGGAEVVNYPWDTWVHYNTSNGTVNVNADYPWWERVCTAYVDSTRLISANYMSDVTSDGISEGGDWYVITGGRQDYMNYFHHCREVTIELDATKRTPVENLNLKWSQNYRSLLNYLQEATYGIRGIITDSCSGQAIRAMVWVNGYDQANDSSQVYSALPLGNYYKYMMAGTYNITFSAPGYKSKTVNNIVLNNGTATVANVQLSPLSSPLAQFTGVQNDLCSGLVQFTNTSMAAQSYFWDFGDGSTSTEVNPQHLYSQTGTFTVKLKAYSCKGTDSLVRTNYISINIPVISNTTDGISCGPGPVALSVSGNGTINWYANPTGGNSLGTGTAWTSPYISTTTTYYAEAAIPFPSFSAIGSGINTTSTTGLTPFSSYYEGSREQYLVKASELTAAGFPAGNITSLSFNVTASGSYAQTNFTIKMAHTANTVITGAYGTPVGGFVSVYTNASLTTPATGWKTFTFSTPFVWNGVSNLLIDICHDNDPTNSCTNCYGTNSTVAYTSTSFNSCFGSYADNAQSCGVQASSALASTYYKMRPNMMFGYESNCLSARVPVIANISTSSKVLHIKFFLEGLYAGNGLMRQAQGASGPQFGAGIADRVALRFHNATSPYDLAYEVSNIDLLTNGLLSINNFPCNISGNYYIVIKHRNSIETWSALPFDFSGEGPFSYDFSTAASQAYGNNQKLMGMVYAIWGGNPNQDGIVDGSDMSAIDNASAPPALLGYFPADINGDGIVDGSDMSMVDNNSAPPAASVKRP